MKKLALALTALTAFSAVTVVTATPADATSWGCGRPCKHAGR